MDKLANGYFYTNHPVVTMRKNPTETSEVVSQAFFSESIKCLNHSEEWSLIETMADGYSGWVKTEEIRFRQTPFIVDGSLECVRICRLSAHLYHVQDTIYGPVSTLPFDSRLPFVSFVDGADGRWIKVRNLDEREVYIQRGDVDLLPVKRSSREQIAAFSKRFLGLPYTWGGRSSFGYDCSGFVQMLYRQMGIYLPRDSQDQCFWKGFKEVAIEEMLPGDLVFFGLGLDKVRHVGMSLGEGSFIHASVLANKPYIHISLLEGKEWQEGAGGKYSFHTARTLIVEGNNS